MSIQQLLTTQADQLEEEIRQDVIEIRRELPKLGYRLKKVYKEVVTLPSADKSATSQRMFNDNYNYPLVTTRNAH